MAQVNQTVKLIIRTTNNKYTDFSIELSSFSSVYHLKENITINHPTKPLPNDQRLIYSGKLLDDKYILNQVFIKSTSGSSFMIHLVLESDKDELVSQSTNKPSIINEESASVSSHSAIYDQYMDELNRYQQQLQQFLLNPNGMSAMPNIETQVYLQYCYTHQQMHQSSQNYLSHQRSISATTVDNNINEINQENDRLRILQVLIDFFVIHSIIYFYSTFTDFRPVFIILALLFLHWRGYFPNQPQQPPVNEQPVGNDNNEDQTSDDQQPPSEPIIDNEITPTRLLLTAISTFFSSLIPERA